MGAPDALRQFTEHPDPRIQDAAKGCLLQLGLLDDQRAQQANQVLDPTAGVQQEYDVFLSHKRSDAKDFARGEQGASFAHTHIHTHARTLGWFGNDRCAFQCM